MENQTVKVVPAVKVPAVGGEDRDDEVGALGNTAEANALACQICLPSVAAPLPWPSCTEYYNLCRRSACKRPHPWAAPHRQVASWQRKEKTGRYGHGSCLLAVGSVGN